MFKYELIDLRNQLIRNGKLICSLCNKEYSWEEYKNGKYLGLSNCCRSPLVQDAETCEKLKQLNLQEE